MAVILGHRLGKHPIYLYDSIQTGRDLLFQQYLTHAYQADPFYRKLMEDEQQGVFRYEEVATQSLDALTYRNTFYVNTGWQDELCLAVKIERDRWVVMYLGLFQASTVHHTDSHFCSKEVQALELAFELIAALCRQHWHHHPFHLGQSAGHNGGQFILNAVQTFGAGLLSSREQQIASLLLQGLDSEEISEQLGITHGTVKNHRKKIYSQLHVTSLSELFRLFLNYAIASSHHDIH